MCCGAAALLVVLREVMEAEISELAGADLFCFKNKIVALEPTAASPVARLCHAAIMIGAASVEEATFVVTCSSVDPRGRRWRRATSPRRVARPEWRNQSSDEIARPWARQNSRTAALNCSGCSRLLTWPAAGDHDELRVGDRPLELRVRR